MPSESIHCMEFRFQPDCSCDNLYNFIAILGHKQILQSSIPGPRPAWKFAYSLTPTDRRAHTIITMLMAMVVGPKV